MKVLRFPKPSNNGKAIENAKQISVAQNSDDNEKEKAALPIHPNDIHNWQQLETDEGKVYYHNTVTDETKWTL